MKRRSTPFFVTINGDVLNSLFLITKVAVWFEKSQLLNNKSHNVFLPSQKRKCKYSVFPSIIEGILQIVVTIRYKLTESGLARLAGHGAELVFVTLGEVGGRGKAHLIGNLAD